MCSGHYEDVRSPRIDATMAERYIVPRGVLSGIDEHRSIVCIYWSVRKVSRSVVFLERGAGRFPGR